MSEAPPAAEVIIDLDTYKLVHAAVAISAPDARLSVKTVRVGAGGYRDLEIWARSLGPVQASSIEGAGSYGAGVSRFLRERGHAVLEVSRPNRQLWQQKGKSDPLDADAAARAVLTGHRRDPPAGDRHRRRETCRPLSFRGSARRLRRGPHYYGRAGDNLRGRQKPGADARLHRHLRRREYAADPLGHGHRHRHTPELTRPSRVEVGLCRRCF
jgi:hypothetical protein